MQSVPDIYFKSADIDSVESVESNPEAVTFEMVLSAVPPVHWIEEFDYLYGRAQFILKPPIEIERDRMRIMYLSRYSDELQSFVLFLSEILEQATREARRTIEILQTDEKEKIKAEFRQTLSLLKVPDVKSGKVLAGAA